MKQIQIDGILIAAGYSQRMNDFKPLLKYQTDSFVVSILKKMVNVCQTITVVTGFRSTDVESEIHSSFLTLNSSFMSRLRFAYNPNFDLGMFTSLQAAINNLENSEWILYHFVDQPTIPQEFYSEFSAQLDNNYDWIQPMFNGVEGHPILMKNSLFHKILDSSYTSKLSDVRNDGSTKRKLWECNYPQIHNNINTKADLEKIQ